MSSFLSKLAPLVITLRGSKRMFRSEKRTLARVARLQEHPDRFDPPAALRRSHSVTHSDASGWPVYTVSPRDAPAGRHALYLHGGCYVFEIDPIHWALIGKLATEAGVTVTVPIMPLAPSGTASAVVPGVADLVASLIAEHGAQNLSIVGDSSGGGMALAVAMELRDRGLGPLRATVLIAPWLDTSATDPQLAVIAPRDPWLAVPGTHAAGLLYRAELPEDDWRVSPIHGSLKGLAPITMFSGTRDILHADATRFIPLALKAKLPVDYFVGEGMIHNYPILPMPEGDAARAVIVKAIR
ncbi:alpha/beta hydrolase fold domain-containing protein [soil metagenome]